MQRSITERHCYLTSVYDDSYFEAINHHVVIDYQFLVECGEAPSWNEADHFGDTSAIESESWPYDIFSTLHEEAYETLLEEVFSFPTFPSQPPQPKLFPQSQSSDSRSDSDSDSMSDSEAEYSVEDAISPHTPHGEDVPPDFPPPPPPLSPPLSTKSSQTPSTTSSTSVSATSTPLSSPKMEPKVTDQKLTKLQVNLEGIKLEILRNISNYVTKMTILKNSFLNHPELSDKSLTLKKDDRTNLLMNVGQIVRCALILETTMDEVRDDSSMKGIFRVLYEHFKKYYKHYVSYCTGIKGMQETLFRLLKENKTFSAELTKIENAKDIGGFGLSRYLDIPKERMFQMKMILTRASKSIATKAKEQVPSASDNIEAENCAKALGVVNEICEESNKNLALEEMRDMYDKFVFPDGMESPLSMTTLHEIVKKGEVTKFGESNGQTRVAESTSIFKWSGHKLWLFLFDHYILIAKKKLRDLTYDVKDFCPTNKAFITTTKHLDSQQKDSDNKYKMVLVLEQNHKNERSEWLFSCAEKSDRDDWLDVMTSLHITIGVGASHLYGKNLVDNSSGQDLLAHWHVMHNDGDGWKIEINPETWTPTRQASCFDTSFSEFSAKEQTIDLSAKGISPRRMDEEPHIHVGEWYAGRNDCTTKYELMVELLNENKLMMTEYIFKEVIDESKGGKWKHVSHEFRNYGKGVRYVRYTHSGHNGCKMTEATVKIKSLTAGDKQSGDRPGLDKQVSASNARKTKSTAPNDSSSGEDDSKPVVEKSESSEESVESNDDDDNTGLNASKCFVCRKDLTVYIPVDGEVYCPSCYEQEIAEKCVKCKKAFLSLGVTYAGQPWHKECFTCTHCSTELSGTKFNSRDEKPYCMECFGELYAKRCATCCKPIAGLGDSRFVSAGDRDWHNDCFKCTHCRAALVGKGFFLDANENITCAKCIKK